MPKRTMFLMFLLGAIGCSKDSQSGDTGACVPNGFFADLDSDGFGDPNSPLCDDEIGVEDATDCDDAQASVNPDASETCATIADDNCDGSANDMNAIGCETFYGDGDGDGFPGDALAACICEADETYTSASIEDCDDTLSSVNPDAEENCATEWDDNCDDELNPRNAENCILFYEDVDGDGYGAEDSACYCTPTTIYTTSNDGDCDDTRSAAYPGALEFCNGIQEDCGIANWTVEDEYGQVSFETTANAWSDITSSFAVSYNVPSSGTLHICPGEYDVAMVVDALEGVAIEGRGSSGDIVVSSSASRAMTVTDSAVTLSDLTLQGNPGSSSKGGAIMVDGSNLSLSETEYHLKLTDCEVHDSTAQLGGAIYSTGANVYLKDSHFSGNSASDGGAFYLDGSTLFSDRNTIESNEATDNNGGAFSATAKSTLVLEETEVHSNLSADKGGAVYLDDSPFEMWDSAIYDNESGGLGSGIYTYRSNVTCSASSTSLEAGVYGNQAIPQTRVASGTGIYAYSAASGIAKLTIDSDKCDFGTSSSTSQPDNSPGDLFFMTFTGNTKSLNYDNNASFTCVMQGALVQCQ